MVFICAKILFFLLINEKNGKNAVFYVNKVVTLQKIS